MPFLAFPCSSARPAWCYPKILVLTVCCHAVFLPDGAEKTLAEEKPDAFNARTIALQCFAKGEHFTSIAPIHDWTGEWQEEEEEGAAQRAPAVSPR